MKETIFKILLDVENGREGIFTDDGMYDFSISLKDITEEEKDQIGKVILMTNLVEKIITKTDLNKSCFETEEYECGKQLNLIITYNALQELKNHFNK